MRKNKSRLLIRLAFLAVSAVLLGMTGCREIALPSPAENGNPQSSGEPGEVYPSVEWFEPEPGSSEGPAGPVRTDVYDPDGFYTHDALAFAARVEGTYQLKGNPACKMELYKVGGNIYGIMDTTESGFAAMEFYADNADDFLSEEANSLDVSVLSFSVQSIAGTYWSDGKPARKKMTITETGLLFEDLGSGRDCMIEGDAEFVRLDEETGNLDVFCYRSDDYDVADITEEDVKDIPKDIVGMWRILGDIEYAPMVEFTPEGLIQVYMNSTSDPVVLFRGNAAVAENKEDDDIQLAVVMQRLGYGASPSSFNLKYSRNTDGTLSCHAGNVLYGEDMFWDGAMLIPIGEEGLEIYTSGDIGKESVSGTFVPGSDAESLSDLALTGFWTLTDGGAGELDAIEFRADLTWKAYIIEPISSHYVMPMEGKYISGIFEGVDEDSENKTFRLYDTNGNVLTEAKVETDKTSGEEKLSFSDGYNFERFYYDPVSHRE